MRLVFNARFFEHVNQAAMAEHGRASRVMRVAEKALGNQVVVVALGTLEHVATFLLTLPIPIYSSLIYTIVTQSRGLPRFGGMYLRALYWRGKLKRMDENVLIDQGVFFANPRSVELSEFSYIDKNVIIMSKSAQVGRRVHIAPYVFISGGGDFTAGNYSCIATGSKIITSTEVLKDGARCSGPMVSADQRKVMRGKVVLGKDAFIGAGAILLPDVEISEGSVIGAGVTVARSTEPWSILVNDRPKVVGQRENVIHPDN